MAPLVDLFLAVLTTGIVILVAATIVGRQPAKNLQTKPPTSRADDIPVDHADTVNNNTKENIEPDASLRESAVAKKLQTKTLTFRVDDIPVDHDEAALKHNLKGIIEGDASLCEAAATLTHHSFVPKDKNYICATVSIKVPVSADGLSSRLREAGTGYPYTYSCVFDGITPLHVSPSGAHVDIIAVPGLGSHPLGSWKSPTGNKVWLRDFLPKDLHNIRVLLYGYDTTLPESYSKQTIKDLGRTFLEQIIAFRTRDGTSYRPIILIGHSLGGLVIKEALVRACRKSNDEDSKLSRAAYGLVFFGVPHLGLRNEQLRAVVDGQPNKALIDELLADKDSEPCSFLQRLAEQFAENCNGKYRAVSFFERKLSPTVEFRDGQWRKTGTPSLLVTEKSATNTGLVAGADEVNIAFNTDHSGLVKYDSSSQGDYTIVRERLRRLVEEAGPEVSRRFAEHRVFMWASLVAERVLQLIREGESRARIEKEIKRIPPTLEGLYSEIIQGAKDPTSTLRLMEWICFSLRPLTPDELRWAMAVGPDCTESSLDECEASDDFIASDKADTRIKVLACGLAEISIRWTMLPLYTADFPGVVFATLGWLYDLTTNHFT
ncbi:uncharacterized protein DNG_05204 [Cephalotrichum gorgonifer]|uniref:AB hydrolase-1 domain-containing protein n=1 Tax=Cephalotrichum gorgonifer TaxID=2041049 RepID=A0AAE8MXH1_9PEZI|nr:uncharacterized protein DNG_05204 [Cephalotrichum gorgonifer]